MQRRLALFVVSMWVIAVCAAAAQTVTGSMSGTVVDDSGQGIPGADVTITHESTAEERKTVTSNTGDFVFPGLIPGPYTIRVQLSGFRPLEVKNNVVGPNSRLAVGELKLGVGELIETITVSAQGEALATTRTSHEAILDVKQVQNLSIRGRDPISLLKILPGVSLLPNDQETFGGSFATAVPNIQGGRGQTIYVDGVNGGDSGNGSNFSGATNLDAIAEVNVQMSAYTAEYGLKGGAQVNYITKRGGAQYHGTGYWYYRNEGLNSTNFFNKRDGLPKPEYRYSTLGGNLGGPVPKFKGLNPDGKKLFFFYSLDDTQLKNPQVLRRFMMPTALERQGDFSQTRTSSGALVVVRDPVTQQPYPGNRIPVSQANAAGLALMNLLPMPNTSGSGYNYVVQEPSIDHPRRQHLLRVDYRPTDKDSFGVKYQTWYTRSVGVNVAGASARWGLVRQRYDFTADQAKIDYTRIWGPNTVMEMNAGVFYSTENGPPEDDRALASIQRSSYPALAGLPQFAAIHNPLNLIPRAQFGTLQTAAQADYSPNITYDGRWPITGADTALVGSINLTHTRGAHTFKAGLMREYERFGQARSGTFAGEFSFANDGADPTNTGFAFANMYTGHVTSYTESMGRVGDNRRQNTWAWFVQDTWKPTRKLTIDMGLRMYRWDHPLQGGGEASAFSLERFDPRWGGNPPVLFRPVTTPQGRRAQNPLTGEILPNTFIGLMVPGTGFSCGVITPKTPCTINGVVIQTDGNYIDGERGFIEPVGLQYDPRLGMAYAVNDKTVVRVAGGLFHDATGGSTFTGGPAYRFERVIRFTDINSYMTGTSATSISNVSGSLREDQKRPVTYRFTAAIQRELGWKTVLDVAYVGDRTHNLGVDTNINQVPAGARFLPQNRDFTQPDTATVGLQPGKPNPGALPDVFLRPIVGFGDITITESSGKSSYDSLQLQLTRRFTGHVELAGSYTYAKGYQNFQANNVQGASQYSLNPLPPGASRFRTAIQPHVVNVSYMVDLPSANYGFKPAQWILNDWRVSGITTLAGGAPAAITFGTTDSFDFTGGGERCGNNDGPYPLIVGDPILSRGDRNVDRWFDTSAFARPTGRGDIGNSCSNAMIFLPGWTNHDLSFFKDFRVRGNQKLQFRWEIYNLFDTLQFQDVDRTAQFDAAGNQTDAAFGKVLNARNERRMQLSIRYTF